MTEFSSKKSVFNQFFCSSSNLETFAFVPVSNIGFRECRANRRGISEQLSLQPYSTAAHLSRSPPRSWSGRRYRSTGRCPPPRRHRIQDPLHTQCPCNSPRHLLFFPRALVVPTDDAGAVDDGRSHGTSPIALVTIRTGPGVAQMGRCRCRGRCSSSRCC